MNTIGTRSPETGHRYQALSRLSRALLRRHSIVLVAKLGKHAPLFLNFKNLPALFLTLR